ncbi:MAG: hypothetical protein NT096_09955 [Proteobacteria bacterium]|nr:hypothetical protein [Pseudomonadota bacterium]
MKPIRLSAHARENLSYRGTTEQEVIDTIRTAPWGAAEHGRLECRKEFQYKQDWNGKFYNTKQVRPILVEETEEIVVVTVYVYYF